MAIVIGDLIEAQHYNDLALEVNRLYSDNTVSLAWATSNRILDDTADPAGEVAGAVPRNLSPQPNDGDYLTVTVNDLTLDNTEYSVNFGTGVITFLVALPGSAVLRVYNRETHRFGWGQQASVYPISAGELVRADEATLMAYIEANTNNLLDKVNIMEDRTGGPTELTRFAKGDLIRAADKILIQDSIDNDILSGENYYNNVIATVSSTAESFARVTDWDNILIGEWRYSWDNYNSFRYFFNSGCELRLLLEITGDESNQGYWNWAQVINNMGTLRLDWTRCTQTGINGTGEELGAYDLTSTYQLVFTSGGPPAPRDDSGLYDEYSTYEAMRVVWEARITDNTPSSGNISLDVRATLDDLNLNTTTVGTTTFNAGMFVADDVVDNSATFSMTANEPTITELNNFENGDDS